MPGGTFSFEIPLERIAERPPFCDSCPLCADLATGVFVPYATTTEGNTLVAFYRHGRCGHQWSCQWEARWAHSNRFQMEMDPEISSNSRRPRLVVFCYR